MTLFNLARMTTATTGTGTITLGSAVSGFLTFAQAGVTNGTVVSYGIVDGANREVGTGTYTAAGTTLTRTVVKSTNSDSAINLSGSAEVFITPLASDLTKATNDYSGISSGTLFGNATVSSASAIAAPTGGGVVLLTGTTAVNTMTGGTTGQIITLVASGQAAGICVVLNHATSTNNLDLRDDLNFGLYAGESLTLQFDGTKWVEISRNFKKVLSYTEITSDVNITGTAEATATAAISASAITFDGATPVRIDVYVSKIDRGTGWIVPVLYDGTSVGLFAVAGDIPITGAYEMNKPFVRRLTPTNASHTYSFRCYVDAGTGVVRAGAGGAGARMPSHMTISRDI